MKEVEHDDKWVEEEAKDPFAPEYSHIVMNITLMRIYDVLMAQLSFMDGDAADRLVALHARGGLVSPPPGFNPEEVYKDE